MSLIHKIKLEDFLRTNKYMSIKPSKDNSLIVEGKFSFIAKTDKHRRISDFYRIRITITNNFPSSVPTVEEIGDKIPKTEEYHINPREYKYSLCLGSPLRLLELLNKNPTLEGFVQYCLIPYLYGISLKIQYGENLVFGELAHGNKGIFDEYQVFFNIKEEDSLKQVIKMLSLKKRIANKKTCPCGCKKRLGKCSNKLNIKINKFRYCSSRAWYSRYFDSLN